MRPELQAHIDELLGQYRQLRDNLGRMQHEMTELTATVQSPDGMVRATVGYRGDLTKLDINPRAYRVHDTASLAELIVETTAKAAAQVRAQIHALVAPNLPDVAGLSRMGGDFDLTKLFPEDPKDMTGTPEARP